MLRKNKKLNAWNRERTLVKRDFAGNIMPVKVLLLGDISKEIIIKPLTIGELNIIEQEINVSSNLINNIPTYFFKKCLISPILDPSLFSFSKYDVFNKVLMTVLFECGYDVLNHAKKKKLKKRVDSRSEKRKLYELIKRDENTAMEATLLHELGYTFFTLPKLTVREKELLLSSNFKLKKATFGSGKENRKTMGGRKV